MSSSRNRIVTHTSHSRCDSRVLNQNRKNMWRRVYSRTCWSSQRESRLAGACANCVRTLPNHPFKKNRTSPPFVARFRTNPDDLSHSPKLWTALPGGVEATTARVSTAHAPTTVGGSLSQLHGKSTSSARPRHDSLCGHVRLRHRTFDTNRNVIVSSSSSKTSKPATAAAGRAAASARMSSWFR
jgi:hypothetical protein